MSTISLANGRTKEETAMEALRNMENLERNYIAIISPNTNTPMLHLKKHGDCTLIDPRACIHHYECRADVACILYAHVSLRYFHYMVHMGYVSNKTRVVLHDTVNDTFVFVLAENIRSAAASGLATVDDILGSVRQSQSTCQPGIDVLQAATEGKVGYMFTQPTSFFRKNRSTGTKGPFSTTTKVLSRREWEKRLKNEKKMHDCQRKIFNENRKKELSTACSGLSREGKDEPPSHSSSFHIPILVIEGRFNIRKQEGLKN